MIDILAGLGMDFWKNSWKNARAPSLALKQRASAVSGAEKTRERRLWCWKNPRASSLKLLLMLLLLQPSCLWGNCYQHSTFIRYYLHYSYKKLFFLYFFKLIFISHPELSPTLFMYTLLFVILLRYVFLAIKKISSRFLWHIWSGHDKMNCSVDNW